MLDISLIRIGTQGLHVFNIRHVQYRQKFTRFPQDLYNSYISQQFLCIQVQGENEIYHCFKLNALLPNNREGIILNNDVLNTEIISISCSIRHIQRITFYLITDKVGFIHHSNTLHYIVRYSRADYQHIT